MPSRETNAKVISALRSIGRPALVSELVAFTGMTTNTVKSVLRERGYAEPGYPTRWSLAADVIHPRRLDTVKTQPYVEVPYLEGRDWHKKLQSVAVRRVLNKMVALSAVPPGAPGDKPEKIYEAVAEAAALLGSLAFDIQESMQGPDWFERLGGKTEETL